MYQKQVTGVSSASPKARKFARELGVNINEVLGSEKDGRVVEDDIKKFVSLKSVNNKELKKLNLAKSRMNMNMQNLEK